MQNTSLVGRAENAVVDYATAQKKEAEEMDNLDERLKNLTSKVDEITGGNGTGPTPEPPTEIASGQEVEKHINIGDTFTITLKDVVEDTEIKFTNSVEGIVDLDEVTKTVTGKKIGIAKITATWNGTNTATINVHVYDPDTIGAPQRIEDYGKIVVNYEDTENNKATGQYRLFYQDKNYTYIISDNIIELTGSLEDLYTTANKTSGADVGTWGQRLNPKLIDAQCDKGCKFFESGNTNENIKGVAWLTDEEQWEEYATGEGALYAIGGPTAELFAASYNAVQSEHEITLTPKDKGYSQNTEMGWFEEGKCGGIYETADSGAWWIASPYYDADDYVMTAETGSFSSQDFAMEDSNAVRPLVCFQTSVFNEKYGKHLTW